MKALLAGVVLFFLVSVSFAAESLANSSEEIDEFYVPATKTTNFESTLSNLSLFLLALGLCSIGLLFLLFKRTIDEG